MSWVSVQRDVRGVAVVTIDNPAKLNTLNTPVMTDLIAAVELLGTDATLRAVVLRGAGERAFIGGADINEMAGLEPASARAFITLVHRSCDVFRRLPVPVIARIQGYVFGAGVEVAAACDMRVASIDARFGMPEVRLGVPSVVEAALLPQLIGWGRTRQWLLTGDTIDAATAQAWGLVEGGRAGATAGCRGRTAAPIDPGIRPARSAASEGADHRLGGSAAAAGGAARDRQLCGRLEERGAAAVDGCVRSAASRRKGMIRRIGARISC